MSNKYHGNPTIRCPFYVRYSHSGGRSNKYMYCEFARLSFPDNQAKAEMMDGVCSRAGPDGWQSCPIYRMSCKAYDRKLNK